MKKLLIILIVCLGAACSSNDPKPADPIEGTYQYSDNYGISITFDLKKRDATYSPTATLVERNSHRFGVVVSDVVVLKSNGSIESMGFSGDSFQFTLYGGVVSSSTMNVTQIRYHFAEGGDDTGLVVIDHGTLIKVK